MAAQFIGAIVGSVTGNVYAIINPDDDSELDNPRHLLLQSGTPSRFERVVEEEGEEPYYRPIVGYVDREPMMMVRIARDQYMAALSMDDVAAIVSRLVNRQ